MFGETHIVHISLPRDTKMHANIIKPPEKSLDLCIPGLYNLKIPSLINLVKIWCKRKKTLFLCWREELLTSKTLEYVGEDMILMLQNGN